MATFDRYWYGTIPELLERCITVAASVSAYAAERRYVIGLVANGCIPRSDQPIKVAPGRDPQQLSRVLEALAVVTPVANQSIAELLAQESPRLPWGATLAIVTANLNEELNSTLLAPARRGPPPGADQPDQRAARAADRRADPHLSPARRGGGLLSAADQRRLAAQPRRPPGEHPGRVDADRPAGRANF